MGGPGFVLKRVGAVELRWRGAVCGIAEAVGRRGRRRARRRFAIAEVGSGVEGWLLEARARRLKPDRRSI